MQTSNGVVKYLMDANAIRSLSSETITLKRNNNRTITTIHEVALEISGRKKLELFKLESLSKEAYRMMGELLARHKSARNVVSYFDNKGAADVGLLAHALTTNEGMLIEDEIIIVTNDLGLRAACDDLSIIWMSSEDFELM